MPFKIRVTESAGFCFGVRKALDKLIEIRNRTGNPVRTLGPLIHNEQVLEALQKRAVHELAENEDVTGMHVLLRAHGVTPQKRRQLQEQKAIVCDATCPKVGQVQAIVKKYAGKGCPVIIIGDRGHAEVDGLLGYSGNLGMVVTGPDEAEKLQPGPEVCVVAQTTQDPLIFSRSVEIIRTKFNVCHEFNTICDATSERQRETSALAVESDIMVVVGGKHSANSRRLAEIAGKHCKTIMIQTENDIDPDMFIDVHRVGITAGASTPAWVIRNVVEKIRVLGWEQSGNLLATGFKILDGMLNHPLFWAIGISLLSFSVVYAVSGVLPWMTSGLILLLTTVWRVFGQRLNTGLDIGIVALLVMIALVPFAGIHQVSLWSVLISAVFLGTAGFSRLLLYDCMHVQTDRISGFPTLPAMCRPKTTSGISWAAVITAICASVGLAILQTHPAPLALIVAPIGFAVFRFRRLKKDLWCSLCDNLYLNAPVWAASILALSLRLIFPN